MDYRPQLKAHNLLTMKPHSQTYISEDRHTFCSRQVQVNQVNRDFIENYTCQWEIQLNNELKDDGPQLFIEVELLFREKQLFMEEYQGQRIYDNNEENQNIKVIQTFKARINKTYNAFSFLPIQFDNLGALTLNATYFSVLKSFQFLPHSNGQNQQKDILDGMKQFFMKFLQDQQNHKQSSLKNLQNHFQESFHTYVSNKTNQFLSRKVKEFYTFHRSQLRDSYFWIQNLYDMLMKIAENKSKDLLHKKKAMNSTIKTQYLLEQNLSKQFVEQFDSMYRQHQDLNQFQLSTKKITYIIEKDIFSQEKQISSLFNQINRLVLSNSIEVTRQRMLIYNQILKQRYRHKIFSHQIVFQKNKNIDFTFSKYDDAGLGNVQCVKIHNSKNHKENIYWKQLFDIESVKLLDDRKKLTIFQEIYLHQHISQQNSFIQRDLINKKKNKQKIFSFSQLSSRSNGKNIIFLVHGFGASKIDIMLLKKIIEIHCKARVIISLENIGKTEDNIGIQGQRFADQVQRYIQNQTSNDFKISFIGHSLGGLVIRSAIPHLQSYSEHFHSYISICTPHLGYLYSPCRLTQIGLWFVSKFEDCTSLQQLTMRDSPNNFRQCALYKLSKNGSLDQFRHIAFLASSQDSYVPYQSSRLEKSQRLLSQMRQNDEKEKLQVIEQMVDNILKSIKKTDNISRMNVLFNPQGNLSIQKVTGRWGHVKFLSDEEFLRQFVICYNRYFQ